MSKLLSSRGDLLQLVREARISLADVEVDFDNLMTDGEVLDSLLTVRDSMSTLMMELEFAMDEYEDSPDEPDRDGWLV
jgi:hypothetical protein